MYKTNSVKYQNALLAWLVKHSDRHEVTYDAGTWYVAMHFKDSIEGLTVRHCADRDLLTALKNVRKQYYDTIA